MDMAQERARESARKRAMTCSITSMVETVEECITSTGGIQILSEQLERGGWGTGLARNRKTGQIDYSKQDAEAERVMARLLYRKLSQAVAEQGDVAYAIVTDTGSQHKDEYLVPKMVITVRGWALYPEEEGGFSTRRLSPNEVEEISPRSMHIRPKGAPPQSGSGVPREGEPQSFEEFMEQEIFEGFDENSRKLTRQEKVELWEKEERERKEAQAGEGPYMPDDEVRYL